MGILKRSKFLKGFLVSIVVLIIGFWLWNPFSTGYFSSCNVAYDQYDHPLILIEVQGHTYELEVRIGSRFPLALSKEILNQIDKQLQGTTLCHDLNGNSYEVLTYLIPRMKVGNLTLSNVLVNQALQEDCGIIGKYLGGEFNLLVDFPHNRIIACDTFSKLQTKKITTSHWTQVPFELTRGGLVLQGDTDLGNCRLILNTTSTFSFLKSSLIPSGQSLISSTFSIGGQEFGSITFQSVDLPNGLNEIDGFLGMDFLKHHAIYLDYFNKIAYIEPPAIYFECFPITFNDSDIPTTNISIEGITYSLEIDLGSYVPFSLSQNILQNIQKTFYGTTTWNDFKGNKYESLAYIIPEIKMGSLKFVNILTNQNKEDFHVNVSSMPLFAQPIGTIGRPILEQYNLFLDFPHSAIYASNSHLHLQQAGLLSKNLLIVPFVLHPDGILLSVGTDSGVQRLLLDTGATHTTIRTPHATSTSQFCLMGHDFGARSLVSLDLCTQFDYDGFLGLDFLREYSLFIDYLNRRIFIDLQ